MAGLLDILGNTAEGIGKVRARIQEPAARMRGKLLDELESAAERRRMNQGQEAYGKAAAALNLNAPDIGAIALLARADPAAASGLLSQAAQSRTPMGQQQLQNTQLAGQATQQGMDLAANQDQRAERSLQLDEQRTMAYIGNMSYDNAAKATANQLTALAGALKSEGDLRNEYQKAPLLVKGAQAVGSWQMLKRSLDENNPMALQAAIVAAAQIQEPGLAVRNDDRIAYSGSNPVVERLVQSFNTAMSGEGLTPGMKQRLLALGTQLAGVHARNIQQITDEYRRLAVNTPGARSDQVTAGVGVDWDTVNFLAEITDEKRQGPGGR